MALQNYRREPLAEMPIYTAGTRPIFAGCHVALTTGTKKMNDLVHPARRSADKLLFAAAAAGFLIALFGFFWSGNGIHGTAGALLVVISSALLGRRGWLVDICGDVQRWLVVTLTVLIALGIVGTALAAYMLEANILLAVTGLMLIGWIAQRLKARPPPAETQNRWLRDERQIMARALRAHCNVTLAGSRGCRSDRRHSASPATAARRRHGPMVGATHYDGWYTFNGDLEGQKFSAADQITPQNVGKLQKAWEVHTGDVSDGSGKIPLSDWSATPLFVNDTVYVSTPFYRIFALAPDTGKVKWTYRHPRRAGRGDAARPEDPRRRLLAGRDRRSRASRARRSSTSAPWTPNSTRSMRTPAQKCTGFANGGVLDINQWNTTNNKWPLSILQPPTVYKDTLFIGWAGKDWADERSASRHRLRGRRADRKAEMDVQCLAAGHRQQDRHLQRLGQHDRRSGSMASSICRSVRQARTFTAATARKSCRSLPPSRRSMLTAARCCGAGRSSITTSGTTIQIPRRFWSISRRMARPFRR